MSDLRSGLLCELFLPDYIKMNIYGKLAMLEKLTPLDSDYSAVHHEDLFQLTLTKEETE